MKKVFLLLIFACSVMTLWGQVGIRAGIKLGAGLAAQRFEPGQLDEDYFFTNRLALGRKSQWIPAFHIAGFTELDVHKYIGFGAGLSVANRGSRVDLGNQFDFESAGINCIYAQIPVYVQARASGFFLNAGPYVGLALGGGSWRKPFKGGDLRDQIVWGNDFEADLRRMDLGLRLEAGGSYRNVRFFVGTDIGLFDLMPSDWDKEIPGIGLYNQALYCGMGYVFSAMK
ncbi:MAG: outer membrane beta-barrel protein [Saprospiraceae bacterium]